MKTAWELLADYPGCTCDEDAGDSCDHKIEWVAERAREEMRDAIKKAVAGALGGEYNDLAEVIDAVPVKP